MPKIGPFFRLALAIAIVVAPSCLAQEPAKPDPWAQHRKIRVLYAGVPESKRERAFLPFLREHFDHVSSIDIEGLFSESSADFDVVIADWDERAPDFIGFEST